MESIHRNIIYDLLPAYMAGEASEESKALVEEFAKNDSQIAELIRQSKLEADPISQKTVVPDDLELKTINKIRQSIRLKVWYVAFATAAILVAPLVAMQFTDEVNWGLMDFVIMGVLLFGTGIAYVLVSRISERIAYRVAVAITVVACFLLIWINLAVGIIGSEDNPANLIYLIVLAIVSIGSITSRFRPLGMARTLFTTAIFQMLIPFIMLVFWSSSLEESPGVIGIFVLNALFALLFVVSALLFKSSAKHKTAE